jgi:hypothetical protein
MSNMTIGRKTGDVIIMVDTMNNIARMLKEISYTDYLQSKLDYGNKKVFKNFKLYLIMEDEDGV